MKAIMIFDNLNDLLFSKWDDTFIKRMKTFNDQGNETNITDCNNVSQLLSPIITSQRVMAAQFGNTYSSMQCKDGTNIVFDEWLDHVFMIISEDEIDDSHRELMDCKTIVQHICGQNINLLHSVVYQKWLSALLDCRDQGDSIPGAMAVIGESGATATALNALKNASKEVKCTPHQHYHLLLFVGDKLLALYSSRGSEDLTPPDLILLSIQSKAAQQYWSDIEKGDQSKDECQNSHLPWLSEENSAIVNLCAGAAGVPCAPHSMHIAAVGPGINYFILVDMDIRDTGIAAHLSSQILSNLRRLLLQRNLEMLPTTLDALDAALKKTTEAMRKNKANSGLCARLTTRMLELRKSCSTTTPLTPETTATAMHTALEAVIEQLRPDIPSLNVEQPLNELKKVLSPYADFLRVKAMGHFGLESEESGVDMSSLTWRKYVEEFPGLVHFVFVERSSGRLLAPSLHPAPPLITPEQVRSTVRRSFRLVREGYSAATWRGAGGGACGGAYGGGGGGGGGAGAVHACSVLWWERAGVAIKPRALHVAAVRALPPPGDILGTFYRQLAEQAFPNESSHVTIKELICFHLGLLPAATAVQQARRLAHTVHEMASAPDDRPRPQDLL